MLLGSIDYIIKGDSFARFYRAVIERDIPVKNMREYKGEIRLSVSAEYTRRLKAVCTESGCTAERQGIHGTLKAVKAVMVRPGLLVGLLISIALMAYFSNFVITLEVETDNEDIRTQVLSVLEEEGITPGAYIPDINYVVIERTLKRKLDDISWAGITRTGCGLSIDLIENIKPVKGIQAGMPCHLVACENGVIDKVEIIDGELKKCIGSGVVKGDIVVSGDYITETSQWIEGKEVFDRYHHYVRSIGKVYGTFERTMTFEQEFETLKKANTPRKEKLFYIDYFSVHIPLFGKAPDGYFTENDKAYTPHLGGLALPFSLCEAELTEYDRVPVTLTEDEAFAEAGEMAYKYEQNFLGEYKLIDRQTTRTVTDNGVKLTVKYTLYGSMCRESEFFMPKNIIENDTKVKSEDNENQDNDEIDSEQ